MRTECCFIMVNQKDQCTDKKQDFWPRHTARALDSDLGFAFYTVVLVLDLHLSPLITAQSFFLFIKS